MANTKLTDLIAITTPASGDKLYIVDVSDTGDSTAGSSKQITFGNLTASLVTLTGTETLTNKTLTSPTITGPTITGTVGGGAIYTSPVLTTPQINDTSANHQYIVAVSELASDRTVTFPLLTGNDTFVFGAHAQDLSNKTFTDQTEFSEDINLATGKNVQVNDADPDMIIELPVVSWAPATTSGCADIVTIEAGTNDIDYKVLDFDASSDEVAFINFQMPTNYDGGVIQFRYVWTNAGGGSAEVLVLELSGLALANSGAIDQAVGTAIEVADTWLAQGDIHISAFSGDVTLAGSPAGGQWVHLEIMRDVDGGGTSDTLTGDARLIGVQIKYKISQYSN